MFFAFISILFLNHSSTASELTTGDNSGEIEVTYDVDVYVPTQWTIQREQRTKRCKPSECGFATPPVVEGKKLMYVVPAQRDYVSLNQTIKSFFSNWAKSCYKPHELTSILPRGASPRPNQITSFGGDITLLENDKVTSSWMELVQRHNPHVLIFMLNKPTKKLSEADWTRIITKIPKDRGCILISSPTERNNPYQFQQQKVLKRVLEKTNSSCQLISADEEVKSHAYNAEDTVFKRNGTLNDEGMEFWWSTSKVHLCNTEPLLHAQPRNDIQKP